MSSSPAPAPAKLSLFGPIRPYPVQYKRCVAKAHRCMRDTLLRLALRRSKMAARESELRGEIAVSRNLRGYRPLLR
eukprot:3233030-Pleurochrysis_carterae.AAC.1